MSRYLQWKLSWIQQKELSFGLYLLNSVILFWNASNSLPESVLSVWVILSCSHPKPFIFKTACKPYYSQNYLVKGTWKGHARVHSLLEKQLLRSPESVHIKVRGNTLAFHLDIEKCPLWLGVQIKWVSSGQPGSMRVICFVFSSL